MITSGTSWAIWLLLLSWQVARAPSSMIQANLKHGSARDAMRKLNSPSCSPGPPRRRWPRSARAWACSSAQHVTALSRAQEKCIFRCAIVRVSDATVVSRCKNATRVGNLVLQFTRHWGGANPVRRGGDWPRNQNEAQPGSTLTPDTDTAYTSPRERAPRSCALAPPRAQPAIAGPPPAPAAAAGGAPNVICQRSSHSRIESGRKIRESGKGREKPVESCQSTPSAPSE